MPQTKDWVEQQRVGRIASGNGHVLTKWVSQFGGVVCKESREYTGRDGKAFYKAQVKYRECYKTPDGEWKEIYSAYIDLFSRDWGDGDEHGLLNLKVGDIVRVTGKTRVKNKEWEGKSYLCISVEPLKDVPFVEVTGHSEAWAKKAEDDKAKRAASKPSQSVVRQPVGDAYEGPGAECPF